MRILTKLIFLFIFLLFFTQGFCSSNPEVDSLKFDKVTGQWTYSGGSLTPLYEQLPVVYDQNMPRQEEYYPPIQTQTLEPPPQNSNNDKSQGESEQNTPQEKSKEDSSLEPEQGE